MLESAFAIAPTILSAVLAVPFALAAYRMIKGPGYADRFVALDMLTAVVVCFSALTALSTGRSAFLDIGLGIVLIKLRFHVRGRGVPRAQRKPPVVRIMIASTMLFIGVAFITIAALGVARLPDVFQRMHAATLPSLTAGSSSCRRRCIASPASDGPEREPEASRIVMREPRRSVQSVHSHAAVGGLRW